MIALVQKVSNASVTVRSKKVAQIKKGLVVFLGIFDDDIEDDIFKVSKKILNLRVFNNSEENEQYSVQKIEGEILLVSQFTLCAQTKKGNRPSFKKAMNSKKALKYFNLVVEELSKKVITKTGMFGEKMEVSLVNNGPMTIILNTKNEKH